MARQLRTKMTAPVRSQIVPAVPPSETFARTCIDPKVLSQDVPRLTCATGDADFSQYLIAFLVIVLIILPLIQKAVATFP